MTHFDAAVSTTKKHMGFTKKAKHVFIVYKALHFKDKE